MMQGYTLVLYYYIMQSSDRLGSFVLNFSQKVNNIINNVHRNQFRTHINRY